jgi:hypothetical protein
MTDVDSSMKLRYQRDGHCSLLPQMGLSLGERN